MYVSHGCCNTSIHTYANNTSNNRHHVGNGKCNETEIYNSSHILFCFVFSLTSTYRTVILQYTAHNNTLLERSSLLNLQHVNTKEDAY